MPKIWRVGAWRGAVVAAAIVATLGAVACGSSEGESSSSPAATGGATTGATTEATSGADAAKKVKIAYFEFGSANTYTQASLEGARAEAKKLGNVEIVPFDGKFDASKQASDMQDALATGGYDGWMVYQMGPAALTFAKQAIDQGVKVVGVLVPFGPDPGKVEPQLEGQLANTYLDHTQLGRDLGDLTVKACADTDPCKVEYLYGYKSLPFSKTIKDGFDNVIKSHPSIEVVTEQDGKYLAGPSYTVTQNALQAHPDLNVVVTGGSQMTLGAERAVNAAGKKGQVKLIGSYGSKLGVDAVCQGRWFGETVSLPYTEGQVAVESIADAVRGKPLPYGPAPDLVKRFSKVGSIITKDNCADFKPQWEG